MSAAAAGPRRILHVDMDAFFVLGPTGVGERYTATPENRAQLTLSGVG
jgi:hypothetical protein